MDIDILDKLKISKHKKVLILNAPQEFTDVLKNFNGIIETQLIRQFAYVQIFITSQSELIENGQTLTNLIDGDRYLWVCYPKGTSKKYMKPDCNRDTLREAIIQHGFEGVSLISLDEDWSAMRFRNSKYVGK